MFRITQNTNAFALHTEQFEQRTHDFISRKLVASTPNSERSTTYRSSPGPLNFWSIGVDQCDPTEHDKQLMDGTEETMLHKLVDQYPDYDSFQTASDTQELTEVCSQILEEHIEEHIEEPEGSFYLDKNPIASPAGQCSFQDVELAGCVMIQELCFNQSRLPQGVSLDSQRINWFLLNLFNRHSRILGYYKVFDSPVLLHSLTREKELPDQWFRHFRFLFPDIPVSVIDRVHWLDFPQLFLIYMSKGEIFLIEDEKQVPNYFMAHVVIFRWRKYMVLVSSNLYRSVASMMLSKPVTFCLVTSEGYRTCVISRGSVLRGRIVKNHSKLEVCKKYIPNEIITKICLASGVNNYATMTLDKLRHSYCEGFLARAKLKFLKPEVYLSFLSNVFIYDVEIAEGVNMLVLGSLLPWYGLSACYLGDPKYVFMRNHVNKVVEEYQAKMIKYCRKRSFNPDLYYGVIRRFEGLFQG